MIVTRSKRSCPVRGSNEFIAQTDISAQHNVNVANGIRIDPIGCRVRFGDASTRNKTVFDQLDEFRRGDQSFRSLPPTVRAGYNNSRDFVRDLANPRLRQLWQDRGVLQPDEQPLKTTTGSDSIDSAPPSTT